MRTMRMTSSTVRRALPLRAAFAGIVAATMLLVCDTGLASTVSPFRYASAALHRDQTALVYLPSGEAPLGGWPVLYLLHGLDGAPGDWSELGNIKATLDKLIASHRAQPMALVMPEGGNSWYVDSAAVGGPGDYETAVGSDLMDAVEDAFPVGADREHRAIGGVSMGGYGALRLALGHPERFAAVAALSPAIWQNVPRSPDEPGGARHDHAPAMPYFQRVDPDTVVVGIDLPPAGSHFGTAFGSPFDPKRFNAANVFTLLQNALEAKKALPAIYLAVGDDDSHGLWRGSIAFFETMQANALPVEFRVMDGDHDWTLWRSALTDLIVFVNAHLGRPAIR